MGVRKLACVTTAAALLATAAAPARAATWQVQDVPGGADDLSLELDFNGPCIPGCSPTPGDPGQPVIGVQWFGTLTRFIHIAGADVWSGVSAGPVGRADVPGEVSLAIDPGGTTHERGHIRLAGTVTLDSGDTQLEYLNADYDEVYETSTVDLVPGIASISGVSIAVTATGVPVVAYQRRSGGDVELVVARLVDGQWQRAVVDTVEDATAGDTAVEVSDTGAFRLLYHAGGIVLGLREGESPYDVMGPDDCTVYGDLEAELDADDQLQGAFTQECAGQQALYHTVLAAGSSGTGLVALGTFSGTSMDLDAEGRAHFSWVENGRLRYQPLHGTAEDVAAASPQATSVRIDRDGHPHVAFVTGDQLRYAVDGPPTCLGARPTILGTPRADTLTGTAGPNVIAGLGGNDVIRALDGDDVVCGGEGNDAVHGGAGTDRILGAAGADTLHGEGGNDHLTGDGNPVLGATAMPDKLYGGPGDDLVEDGVMRGVRDAEDDHLVGGDGNDELVDLAGGADRIDGGAGRSTVFAGPGADTITGGPQADHLDGGENDDVILAGGGDDHLQGNAGDDELLGGDGHDELRGHDGADVLSGQDGDDRLFGEFGPDQLFGGAGDDLLDGGEDADRCEQGAGTGWVTGCSP